MRRPVSLLVSLAVPALLAGQAQPTVAEHIALGDSAHAALAPQQALGHYRAALARDSTNYAALWKAGREAVDIAKQIEGKDETGPTGISPSARPWAGCRAPREARSACASPS